MMTLKNPLLASLVLGGTMFADRALQGQARVPAYVITEIEVADAEAFKEYAPQVQASFVPFGGRYVVCGGKTQSFAGDAPKRVVVLTFDSIPSAGLVRLASIRGSEGSSRQGGQGTRLRR